MNEKILKNWSKKTNGITLIALVITIIVLLILAGITIALITGQDSAPDKAVQARNANKVGEAKDAATLLVTGYIQKYYDEKYLNSNGDVEEYSNIGAYVNAELAEEVTTGNHKIKVESESLIVSDKDGNEIVRGTINSDGTITWKTDTTSTGGKVEPEETISKKTSDSFVGCYADFDGEEGVDGIIYVDLLAQAGTSGSWDVDETNGTYTIPSTVNSSNVKDYVMSETAVVDERFDSTERYVISPARKSTGTKDRFYVMGLENIKAGENQELYWYREGDGNMSDYETATSPDFGAGKTNTTTIMPKWNAEGYGVQNSNDVWANISDEVTAGWFLPSIGEWAAFADAFNITTENHKPTYNIDFYYWSSSQYDNVDAWAIYFNLGFIGHFRVSGSYCIRLSTTF